MSNAEILDFNKRRYLAIAEMGINNAIKAIEMSDFEQAKIELEHIHSLPMLVSNFVEFEEDYYRNFSLREYLKNSKEENSKEVKKFIKEYKDDYKDYKITGVVKEHLDFISRNIIVARSRVKEERALKNLIRIKDVISKHILPNKLNMTAVSEEWEKR